MKNDSKEIELMNKDTIIALYAVLIVLPTGVVTAITIGQTCIGQPALAITYVMFAIVCVTLGFIVWIGAYLKWMEIKGIE